MVVHRYLYLLFTTLLFALNSLSQPHSTSNLSQRAEEVYRNGLLLYREGQVIEALDSFQLHLKLKKEITQKQVDYSLRNAYNTLGVMYRNIGQYDKSLEAYKLTEQCILDTDKVSSSNLATVYINIGNVYRSKLDYVNAESYYDRALAIHKNQDPINEAKTDLALYSIAGILFLQKKYPEALQIIEEIYPLSDTVSNIYLNNLMGNIQANLGNKERARSYYLTAIELTKQIYGENHIKHATALMNYATFLTGVGEFSIGSEILNNAFEIIKQYQPEKGIELSNYLEYIGDFSRNKPVESDKITTFRKQKKLNLHEAIRWYQKSLGALYTQNDSLEIQQITVSNSLSFNDCLRLLKTIADTYGELASIDAETNDATSYQKYLEEALHYYSTIGELTQQARKEIARDESKIQLAQLEYATINKTIETAYKAYKLTSNPQHLLLAFNSSEQLKGSAIFDKISNDIAQENSLIPDSLLELESKLNIIISTYNEKIFEENSAESPDSLLIKSYSDKVFEANRERDKLNRTLEQEYPNYYKLKYSRSFLSVREIQHRLHKQEVILEYVLNETDSSSTLYSFLISKSKILFQQQELTQDNVRSMEYMFDFMTTPDYIFTRNEDSKLFCTSAHDMYRLLIQPFEAEIKNKDLTIIPDGKLNYLAFDGLLRSLPDTSETIDFSRLDYLVRDFNINYANSANILMSNRNARRTFRNHVLAFAPKYNSEQFQLSNASYTLLPLPGVQKEVNAISHTVPTEVLRGTEANEENFRAMSRDYDILHLAMHAYINDSLPAYSRLAFSPVHTEENQEKDGWLNTADIYTLDLKNVQLTVLSACNTGTGKMQKGEGLMSLARGFLYAGCPSIVMSLWEVEDNAGTEIMTSFYKQLKRGKAKDKALRLAKIEYLENANSRMAHPHYWMSFKSIGDQAPIYPSNDVYFFSILTLLILAFAIDQGLKIKKAHRKRRAS